MPHVAREVMAQCVARVLAGERAVDVSKQTQIPYSTLMRHVGKRRAARPPSPSSSSSGSPPPLVVASALDRTAAMPYTLEVEQQVVEWMKVEQLDGRRINKPRVLAKAAELLGWTQPPSSGWYYQFRHRRRDVEGPASNLAIVVPHKDQQHDAQHQQLVDNHPAQQQREAEPTDNQLHENPPAENDVDAMEITHESSTCKACAMSSKAALDAVKVAIIALQAGYSGKLEPAEMAAAYDVVVDPRRACAFTCMQVGPARDLWLQLHIRRVQNSYGDDPSRHE